VPKYVSQLTAFRVCVFLGLLLTCLIIYTRGSISLLGHQTDVSIWFVVLLGLANSLVWPGIWALALRDLGRFTKLGASIMVMGLCGNAILPLIYGYFADKLNVRDAYWVLAPCYCYLIFYALYGHRVRNWNFKSAEETNTYAEVQNI
jgi:MFS transporter, FHS family, L-fucose permease